MRPLGSTKRPSQMGPQMSFETARLTLLACSPADLVTLIDEPEVFNKVVGFHQADGLREFLVSDEVSPEWLAELRAARGADPWRHGFFVVERQSRVVIGIAGFKGPPDSAGMVEIAYGIVPSFEGQGYATEAAEALVAFALDAGQVRLFRAHTLPESNASTRVLEKCGFRHIGTVVDPDDGPVWEWEWTPSESGPA